MKVVLMPPREVIYQRCDDRLNRMIDDGVLDEIASLPPLDPVLPALRALGVPPLRAYLAGGVLLDDALAQAKTGTRQYAKRQMTWFRNQFSDWHHIDEKEIERMLEFIFSKITS